MADRVPAEVFPPGEFIKDEMEVRGWTQADLAAVMGRPPLFVNELLSGRKSITPETADGLAEVFGTSAEFWMNLDAAYRLWLYRSESGRTGANADDVGKRSRLFEFAPVKDMQKRQWIEPWKTASELEESLNSFYGVRVLEEKVEIAAAAKKSTVYGITTPSQLAWSFRFRQLARRVPAARFDPKVFEQGLGDIKKLVAHDAAVRRVPRMLAELGVRMVVVEHLPGSKIDGAALWIDEGRPAVALSMRFDRIDHFWFTLAHECAHILHGDEGSMDSDLVGESAVATSDKPEFERRADEWAADYLIKKADMEDFILRVRPLYSKSRINQFANRLKVHPGVIVGQLQRRKEILYSHSREMLVKVREGLIGSAMTDGWGTIAAGKPPKGGT